MGQNFEENQLFSMKIQQKSDKTQNAMKIAFLVLKATKNAKRHIKPLNVKIWRFRHDLVTLKAALLHIWHFP